MIDCMLDDKMDMVLVNDTKCSVFKPFPPYTVSMGKYMMVFKDRHDVRKLISSLKMLEKWIEKHEEKS